MRQGKYKASLEPLVLLESKEIAQKKKKNGDMSMVPEATLREIPKVKSGII